MKILKYFPVLFLFLFVVHPAFASDEFETTYNIHYQVQTNGITNVNQEISLTNKLSSVYATQYSLTLPSPEIKNIKAHDGDGPCKTEIFQSEESTTITIIFNQQVVGKDKTLTFNLSYDCLDLAQKKGEVWEINIPKISDLTKIDNYTAYFTVPETFGNPAFIRPEPIEEQKEAGFRTYRFTKNRLSKSGINAVFGPFQIFDFTLFYHLQNPYYNRGETEIALPPDTAFQQIILKKIEPKPINVRVDGDGNWLAKYHLPARGKLEITVTGKVKIFSQPRKDFPSPSQESLEKSLLSASFWDVNHPKITRLAKNLKTPKAIYDFVIETLNYDFDRVKEGVQRLGAVKALEHPHEAICMEFTDLFVTLARAAGIPAREVNGFAYTDDIRLRPLSLMADILHAWPEYYDEKKQIWIPVDPTWEETTGGVDYFSKSDLNHFVFAIHGEDSETPYPAGSYKLSDSFGRDVQVAFGKYQGGETSDLKVEFALPGQIFWGESKKGKIIVKNEGQVASYNVEVKITSQGLDLLTPIRKRIVVLPPSSFREIPVELKSKNLFLSGNGIISASVNNQEFKAKVEISSLIWQIIIPAIGTILILLTLFVLLRKKF